MSRMGLRSMVDFAQLCRATEQSNQESDERMPAWISGSFGGLNGDSGAHPAQRDTWDLRTFFESCGFGREIFIEASLGLVSKKHLAEFAHAGVVPK